MISTVRHCSVSTATPKWRRHRTRHLSCLFACITLAWSALSGQAAAQISTPVEQERIERIIHDYLLAHPEVVIESLRAAAANETRKQEAAGHAAIPARP